MKSSSAQNTEPVRTGRPKSEAKRHAILEASAHLFMTRGFKDTSVDAVAANAGVSKQTVYSHFNGKNALLRACVEKKVEEYGLGAENLALDLPMQEALARFGRQFVDLLNDEDVICMYRLLISEATAHPDLTQVFFESGPKPTREAVARFLAHHPQGGSRFEDPRHAAERFFALLEHNNVMHRLLNLAGPMTAEARSEHAERTSAAFMRMYPAD